MSKRPTIYGRTRSQVAAALVEYRAFIRDHPGDDLCPILARSISELRRQVRRSRHAWRLTEASR
jgi:hypothetical protein